jgi:MoxR-like ATPase
MPAETNAPEISAMAELVYLNGPSTGERVGLSADGTQLGRAADCAAVIPDLQVSSFHCQIQLTESGWVISDLDSSNGTFVNGSRISTAALIDGDVVRVGDTDLQFVAVPATGNGMEQSAFAPEAGTEPAADLPPPPPHFDEPAASHTHAAPREEVVDATRDDLELVQQMGQRAERIRQEIGKVIVGQYHVVEEILMAMIGGGHALLIGMPGMAKTLMVSTIAKVFNLDFRRVQFTPDLMPSDITGTEILETNRETGDREFRFLRGPLFCNLLLADEINRTPPKTQAALLEAMQEHRVTVGNQTYALGEPFFVLATQNPIEQEGTYPLPEAQLDRFMFNIWVDYPSADEEEIIVEATTKSTRTKAEPVLTKAEVLQLQEVVRKIPVSKHVIKYATRLVRSTRPGGPEAPDFVKEYVSTGAGPRASQVMIMAAKARAVMEGRIHVSCNDIRKAALPVLRHRILTNFAADSEGLTTVQIIQRLLKQVPEPQEGDYPEPAQKA